MPLRNLLSMLCVVLLSFVCLQGAPGPGRDDQNYEFYRLLVDALDHIEKGYVENVDRRKLLEGALQGMINHLDPYSAYISPTQLKQFEKQTQGHFGGIGIQIGVKNRQLTVISPLIGTPAYRAGVRAGDTIVEIEGESTENISIDEAVNRLMGVEGTQVTLAVVHEGEQEPQKITLVREDIKVESVLGDSRKDDDSWDWIIDKQQGIAYIRINSFISSTAQDLDKAIKQAKAEGMKGLVLDLRTNPGGLLQSAIEVCDMLLKDGMIVTTKGRNTRERPWKASGDGVHTDFPIAIIVNHFSASASEILAAALQDNGRAKIVGERTWGKGSVQNVIELENGSSALKLTTAEYHRPNGHNIHKRPTAKETDEWGVMPEDEFKVEFSPSEFRDYVVWRHERDVIKAKSGSPTPTTDAKETPSPFVDRQLQKAVEALGGQLNSDKAVSRK
jgi:carboxyl-terminal processing protease